MTLEFFLLKIYCILSLDGILYPHQILTNDQVMVINKNIINLGFRRSGLYPQAAHKGTHMS